MEADHNSNVYEALSRGRATTGSVNPTSRTADPRAGRAAALASLGSAQFSSELVHPRNPPQTIPLARHSRPSSRDLLTLRAGYNVCQV